MEQRFETFTVLIGRIVRSIRRIKSVQMAKYNLKGPHVSCLYYLYQCGPMTAGDLCDRCEEDKAAVSRSLDSLEKMGFVDCKLTGGKRYRAILHLTPQGEEVAREICREIDKILEEAGAGLEEAMRQSMYQGLKVICLNLEAITEQEK